MVRDVVLEDYRKASSKKSTYRPLEEGLARGEKGKERRRTLNHGDPRLGLVGDLGLSTEAHDVGVLPHGRRHCEKLVDVAGRQFSRFKRRERKAGRERTASECVGKDLRVCIDGQHTLKHGRVHASDRPDRLEELVLKRRHPFVVQHLLQEGLFRIKGKIVKNSFELGRKKEGGGNEPST